jgi:hypothetical protein
LSQEELEEEFIAEAEKVVAITVEKLDDILRQFDLENLTLDEAKERAEEEAIAVYHRAASREGQEI